MPEPIAILRPQRVSPSATDLSQVHLSLRQNTQFICDGVEYKLDLEEYRERMICARARREHDFMRLNNGTITREDFDERTESYVEDIVTHCLIDEDGKYCGKYNSYTKTYRITLKRVSISGSIYYYDPEDREVYTYGGSALGILSGDGGEIIEYDSSSDDSFDLDVDLELDMD